MPVGAKVYLVCCERIRDAFYHQAEDMGEPILIWRVYQHNPCTQTGRTGLAVHEPAQVKHRHEPPAIAKHPGDIRRGFGTSCSSTRGTISTTWLLSSAYRSLPIANMMYSIGLLTPFDDTPLASAQVVRDLR